MWQEKTQIRQPYRDVIQGEFRRRKEKNALYSLTAFARFLGVSKTTLCEVLAHRRHLSIRNAYKVGSRLGFHQADVERMIQDITAATSTEVGPPPQQELDDETFATMGSWHHYAILSLARIPNTSADSDSIAQKLGISVTDASYALADLVRLNYVKAEDGKLVRLVKSLQTSSEIPNDARKYFHRQNLLLAASSQERVPIEERHFSSITMAIDSRKLDRVKRMIDRFENRVSNILESGESDRVYHLSIQIFPLSAKEGVE